MPSPGPPSNKHTSFDDVDNIYSPTPTISKSKGGYTNRSRAGSSGVIDYSPSENNATDYEDNDHDDDDDASYDDDEEEEYGDIQRDDSGDIVDALAPGEQIITPKAAGQFDLCGSMWKRRGGLGRNAERNWVMRCFTLYGPILCYHEEPNINAVTDPSKPRARLNLSKIETIAEMHSKQKKGLPSQDLLTINIYDPIVHAKRKWEMCCTSKEQQKMWYRAIKGYDGKPVEKNSGGKDGAAEVSEREGGDGAALSPINTRFHMPDLMHESVMLRPAPRYNTAPIMDEVDMIAKAAAKAAEILAEKQSKENNSLSKLNVALMVAVMNVAIYFVRNGSEQTYKVTSVFMNAFVLYMALQHLAPKNGKNSKRGPKARAAKMKKKRSDGDGGRGASSGSVNAQQKPDMSKQKSFMKKLPVGQTIPRAPPTKASELESQVQNKAATSADAIRAYSAAPTSSIEITPHSFANTDPTTFSLRVGPNYKRNKQKAPSGPALYDLVSMDFIYADTALKNAADKFRIPSIPDITDVDTGHAHIPPMLVINTWLPGEEPSMFGGGKNNTGENSETYSIPMVFVLSKDTLEQLKDLENASTGVKLLSEWCKRAEGEADFRGRFKCMGMIENIESTGVPKFIQGYNGKPALVTKSGTFTRHENYIEFTINVNMWAFLARKGLHTLIPTFPDFIFNIGFTIEARKDEEMPEVLLGGCRLMNLDPEKAVVDGVDDVEI